MLVAIAFFVMFAILAAHAVLSTTTEPKPRVVVPTTTR
jgi:hypothetical protein